MRHDYLGIPSINFARLLMVYVLFVLLACVALTSLEIIASIAVGTTATRVIAERSSLQPVHEHPFSSAKFYQPRRRRL